MFASRPKTLRLPLGRVLTRGFEQFEDRRLMSVSPATPAAAAATDDPDVADEVAATLMLRDRRNFMTLQYINLDSAYGGSEATPVKGVYQGNLVIRGTKFVDNIKVQEYPAVRNQAGAVVTPARYSIEVRWVENRRSFHTDWAPVPVTDVALRNIVIFGRDGSDNIEFVTLNPNSVTKVYVRGDDGADVIKGGPNADFLDGGTGDDAIDKIYGGYGSDLIAGGPGKDQLFGDGHEDLLMGEAGIDTMRGGAGNDDLFGGADSDTMFGDSENDNLYGGDGVDTLNGETGVDYLSGGQDGKKDILEGGDHGDTFRPEGTISNNKDKPRHFNPNEGDKYGVGAPLLMSDPNLAWLALDASFASLGGRPMTRMARRA